MCAHLSHCHFLTMFWLVVGDKACVERKKETLLLSVCGGAWNFFDGSFIASNHLFLTLNLVFTRGLLDGWKVNDFSFHSLRREYRVACSHSDPLNLVTHTIHTWATGGVKIHFIYIQQLGSKGKKIIFLQQMMR